MVILSHNVNSVASLNKFFTSCTVDRYRLFEAIVAVYNVLGKEEARAQTYVSHAKRGVNDTFLTALTNQTLVMILKLIYHHLGSWYLLLTKITHVLHQTQLTIVKMKISLSMGVSLDPSVSLQTLRKTLLTCI